MVRDRDARGLSRVAVVAVKKDDEEDPPTVISLAVPEGCGGGDESQQSVSDASATRVAPHASRFQGTSKKSTKRDEKRKKTSGPVATAATAVTAVTPVDAVISNFQMFCCFFF